MYHITYTGPVTEFPVKLQALTAKEALGIVSKLVEKGYSPTIEKDGTSYSLHELELAVDGVRFGDA